MVMSNDNDVQYEYDSLTDNHNNHQDQSMSSKRPVIGTDYRIKQANTWVTVNQMS